LKSEKKHKIRILEHWPEPTMGWVFLYTLRIGYVPQRILFLNFQEKCRVLAFLLWKTTCGQKPVSEL